MMETGPGEGQLIGKGEEAGVRGRTMRMTLEYCRALSSSTKKLEVVSRRSMRPSFSFWKLDSCK